MRKKIQILIICTSDVSDSELPDLYEALPGDLEDVDPFVWDDDQESREVEGDLPAVVPRMKQPKKPMDRPPVLPLSAGIEDSPWIPLGLVIGNLFLKVFEHRLRCWMTIWSCMCLVCV